MFKPGKIIKKFKSKTGKQVIIRYPKWEDLDELLSFINELSSEDTFITYFGQKITKDEEIEYLANSIKKMEKNQRIHLCAFIGDKLVGNCAVTRKSQRSKHVGEVDISVRKEHRNEGLGAKLLKSLVDESKKLGLKILYLGVFENNPRARHLYEKLGFKECGKIPEMYFFKGKYIAQVLMYLKI